MKYNKIFMGITLCTQMLLSEPLDKQKILDIIQSAKEHKSVTFDSKPKEPIIVYKRRVVKHAPNKKKVFVSLPPIPPSSVTLRMQYRDNKQKEEKSIFTTLNQENNSKLKTTATPIKYY